MLGMVLPGVRHVRTPLVTGSLYLLILWMLFGPIDLSTDGDTTAERRLAAAVDLVGRTGVLAALSLVGILLGSLLVIQQSPLRWLRHDVLMIMEEDTEGSLWQISWDFERWVTDRARTQSNVTYGDLLDPRNFDDAFRSQVESAFHRRYDHEGLDDEWGDGGEPRRSPTRSLENSKDEVVDEELLADIASQAVAQEFGLLAARLQIDHESLFNEVDRIRSEAELRYSIAPPLAILSVILAFQLHWAALLALVAPLALFWHATRSEREARRRVAEALQFGVIKSPTLERLAEIQRD